MRNDWQLKIKWNVNVFRVINNKRSKFLDKFYKKFFKMGKTYSLPFFLPLFYIWGDWRGVVEVAVALLITGILMPAIKYTFRHKRPAALLENVNLLEPVSLKSFPSADTAYAFTLFGVSIFFFPVWAVFLMGLYAFLIAYGRIYMGAHFPIDVLTGAFLGLLAAILGHYIVGEFLWQELSQLIQLSTK